jgi:hypothetical protein
MSTTSKFVATNVQWNSTPSRAMGAPAGEMIRTNRRSASIYCNGCGHGWSATSGRGSGQFWEVLGGVVVTCPKCGVEEQVPDKQFM